MTIENVPQFVGKTIELAYIECLKGWEQTLFLKCTDGTLFEVSGFQEEGYGTQIFVNDVTASVQSRRRTLFAP